MASFSEIRPGGADPVVWAISEKLEALALAIKGLRQERDDAVEAAQYNSVISDERKERAEDLELRLKSARAEIKWLRSVGNSSDKGPGRPNRRKLNSYSAGLICGYHENGATVTELALAYDVHPSTISRIVNGKAYA
jgi:DNA-binding transcriptional ArsR family regulator